MPASRKRKDKQTGKAVRVRHVSPVMLTAYSRGMCERQNHRSIDYEALDAALCRLASQGRLDDLKAIAVGDTAECVRWADRLAAENPNDSRWDEWRSYRKAALSDAN